MLTKSTENTYKKTQHLYKKGKNTFKNKKEKSQHRKHSLYHPGDYVTRTIRQTTHRMLMTSRRNAMVVEE